MDGEQSVVNIHITEKHEGMTNTDFIYNTKLFYDGRYWRLMTERELYETE